MGAVQLISPNHAIWLKRFASHASVLNSAIPSAKVEHIGSTFLGFIRAKDVVDILIGVTRPDVSRTSHLLAQLGYNLEGTNGDHAWHCWPNPERRTVIVHIVEYRSRQWEERLMFRDFLLSYPRIAREYEMLKMALAEKQLDWTEYTSEKSSFVATVVKLARQANYSQSPSIEATEGDSLKIAG